VAVLRVNDQSARAAPLVRLVGLYTALVALNSERIGPGR
jgi:predicted benzoate:H+ symporter BenE